MSTLEEWRAGGERTQMTAHTDMVYEVDVLVGKLVEALEQRGLLKNTVIS